MQNLNRILWMLCVSILTAAPVQCALADDGAFESDAGTRRLEQRTPAGVVPPAADVQTATPGGGDEQPSIAEAPSLKGTEVMSAFRNAYMRAGSPRLAIYFNRELSDEVREWIPGDSYQAEERTTRNVEGQNVNGPYDNVTTKDSKIHVRTKHYVSSTGGRADPSEAWKWEFEDAITGVFLESNATVVDRAVIFRQMAKQAPQSAGLDGAISTTMNEMSALDKFADLLVEMQVTRAPSSPSAYDFRATAKHIKTGRIVGTAFLGYDAQKQIKPRYATGAKGYQLTYPIERVSRELTLKLMQSLTPQIGR